MEQSSSYDHHGDDDHRIQLQIIEHPPIGSSNLADNLGSSFFEPQLPTTNDGTPKGGGAAAGGRYHHRSNYKLAAEAPEKKLTLFALRIAVLEKVASGLGKLGFLWATVVLLGGFASSLGKKDFYFITVILLTEGTRVFSRSHELEWQHQATWSVTAAAGRYSFLAVLSGSRLLLGFLRAIYRLFSAIISKARTTQTIAANVAGLQDRRKPELPSLERTRTWRPSEIPFFPHPGWIFLSRNVSRVLSWLQIISALACMTLSLMRFIQQDYGDDGTSTNRRLSLNIFYALAVTEALMFLVEKAYWEWTLTARKLLDRVNNECNLGDIGLVSVRRFLYDAYSNCISGSIFDGLKMDLVSFAEELLNSEFHDEQLMGAWILYKFVTNDRFSAETLRKIGTSTTMMERLVDMLNWKNSAEEKIRLSAAEIVSKLAGKKQNALRVAGIPGAMESISSLLNTGGSPIDVRPYEIHDRNSLRGIQSYDFSSFNLLGLRILKKLAHDHDNCCKIGNARVLLAKIIDFTGVDEALLKDNLAGESQVKLVKRALQVVQMLASTTGSTGEMLRQEIADNVFTISNIREILEHGMNHMELQKLGIEILTSLAMDEAAREKIGSTGGVIKLLLAIFFMAGVNREHFTVGVEAGEALAMLALESESNCRRILNEAAVVERLAEALDESLLRVNACRMLRNLCAYSGDHESFETLKGVTAAIPAVLNSIMRREKKQLEVSIGLAAQIFRFTDREEYENYLQAASITDFDFAQKLVDILADYKYPDTRVPSLRRYIIQLATWMMKSRPKYIKIFKDLRMESVLKCVAESTSELECFNVFSGSVGLSRSQLTVYSLVDTALELITQDF